MKSEPLKRLKKILDDWFYSEPLFFSVYVTHTFVANDNLTIPLRTGKLRIEYSPLLVEKLEDDALEEHLKIEIYRILLGHPYKRRPYKNKSGILLLASDITINQFYKTNRISLSGVEYFKFLARRFRELDFPLGEKWHNTDEEKFFMRNLNVNRANGNLETLDDLDFESWYSKILFVVEELSIAGSENAGTSGSTDQEKFSLPNDEASELWEENQEAEIQIQSEIQKAEREQGWGGLSGGLKRSVIENAGFSFDYRRVLQQFRANVINSKRTLTRMRPSRRFGFSQMGSRYERKANLLIAVDVSGSITDESFNRFFHVINNFFFCGIEKLDLIFFDVNLKNTKPVTIKKKVHLNEIQGRGGTNFQVPVDFFQDSKDYDGLIIFTDGQGNAPNLNGRKSNVLWIITNRLDYENSRQWIENLNGSKCTYLPF